MTDKDTQRNQQNAFSDVVTVLALDFTGHSEGCLLLSHALYKIQCSEKG